MMTYQIISLPMTLRNLWWSFCLLETSQGQIACKTAADVLVLMCLASRCSMSQSVKELRSIDSVHDNQHDIQH